MDYPAIPKNPATIAVNGWITDMVLHRFIEKYLPAWTADITSGYRSQRDQELLSEKGLSPATYSAHLYNLARDFVLKNKASGIQATDTQMKKLWAEFIKPNWEGYTYFGEKNAASTSGWIHVNLDRGVTNSTVYLGLAASALTIGLLGKKAWNFYQTMRAKS